MPDLGAVSSPRVKGRRPNTVSSNMVRSVEAALTLLSGASAMPKYAVQARRWRMTSRKLWILATTGGGGLPASTISKCRRARLSSRLRKKARAISRCTRGSPGRRTRMAWKTAIASSSLASNSSSVRARRDAASAVMPLRNIAPMRTCSPASDTAGAGAAGGFASWAAAGRQAGRESAARTRPRRNEAGFIAGPRNTFVRKEKEGRPESRPISSGYPGLSVVPVRAEGTDDSR